MRPPRPFTRLRYVGNSPGKVQVPVPPGTVIDTDPGFAAALQAADGHFRAVPVDEPEAVPADDAGEEPAKSRKPRTK